MIRGANSKRQIIIADPDWGYMNYGMAKHGAARAHYPGSAIDAICAVDVPRWADPAGCLLFLWCTGPKGAEAAAHKVAEAWGFDMVSKAFTWVKVNDACAACGASWDAHEPPGPKDDFPGRAIGCARFVPTAYCGTGNYTMAGTEDVWLARRGKHAFAKLRARKDVRHTVFRPVREHSKKPEAVQDRIEMLWPGAGRRLELYATRLRARWTCWGLALGHELGPHGVRASISSAGPNSTVAAEPAAMKG